MKERRENKEERMVGKSGEIERGRWRNGEIMLVKW